MNGIRSFRFWTVLVAAVLGGCATPPGQRAPVTNLSFSGKGSVITNTTMPVQRERMQHDADWRPQAYVVQKGDTLYSIAFNFGFDYRDLADLNGIKDPTLIHVGQEIRLFPANQATTNVVHVTSSGPADIESQPVVGKLPYSEQAVAQIEKQQSAPHKITPKPLPVTTVVAGSGNEAAIQWGMPTTGQVIAGFSESDNRKGIDIAGSRGQKVSASAAGKVVYSGSGLRGYGKLVIIKHNSTYLSAYAHNDRLLVKEGQLVAKGQKIAEMGSTDANRVELHFEIRKLGRPVDPARYLPLPKS